jgi:hypothetical protein
MPRLRKASYVGGNCFKNFTPTQQTKTKVKSKFITFLLLLFIIESRGQSTSNAIFEKIEIIYYKPSKNKDLDIEYYVKIDKSGLVSLRENYTNGTPKFFKTTLPDSVIKILNQIFDGDTPLRTHMIKTSMDEGLHYGGAYNFISYVSKTGKLDNLCYIDVFMSSQFLSTFRKIRKSLFIYDAKYETDQEVKVDPKTIVLLKKSHRSAKYLPIIESPPPASN